MRVLYVTSTNTVHDQRFVSACLEQGHEVWFCAWDDPVGMATGCPDGAARWPDHPDRLAAWQGTLHSLRIDLIHAGPIPSIGARIAGRFDLPLVLMSWGSDILVDAAQSSDARRAACKALRAADAVVADCDAVVKKIDAWIPRLRRRCVVFPWGLELGRFDQLPRTTAAEHRLALGWKDNIVLISTRSWEPLYGIDRLVGAFARAKERLPLIRLILASSGSMGGIVREKIHALGMGNSVHCTGRLSEAELPAWFCAADLYVSSASSDGTSVSLLEAFACGLPAIAHHRYGNLEWIKPGCNGWLTDCTSEVDIAVVIAEAIGMRSIWSEMGMRNRELVQRHADWKVNSRKLSDAYNLAVENHYR